MAKKAARAKPRTKSAPGKKGPTKQALRNRIRKNVRGNLGEAMKLQRRLEKQKLPPDEVASRVGKKLDQLSNAIVADVLRIRGVTVFN